MVDGMAVMRPGPHGPRLPSPFGQSIVDLQRIDAQTLIVNGSDDPIVD